MKTQELFDLLKENSNKSLLFEYSPGNFVGANYHITEVKHTKIDSVDCGAGTDTWNETIIQLWESPTEKDKIEYMSAFKAEGILKKVGKMKPYDMDAEVKFEYGNNHFHTAQLFVDQISSRDNSLIIHLNTVKTDCKAKEICGIPVPDVAVNIASEPCCSPDGNCC